jgi:endonuclease/exonuclease/phosphatase family metal-dependent hydrolase
MPLRFLRPLASPLFFLPEPVEPMAAERARGGVDTPLPTGAPFRVVSWNVQFCAGRRGWFFYDGGPDVRVTPLEVEDTLTGIIGLLADASPDIVFLQEVDRNSTRTGHVDQHARIALAMAEQGLVWHASTPYFRVPFVPVPPTRPLGAVDMHLSVFSRFPLADGSRIALSPLQEPLVRRLFNLRRALATCAVQTDSGPPLMLFHTHLSAFSRGDGTLARQVRTVLRTVTEQVGTTGGAGLLVGDFNSLPPGDDPARLGEAAVLYAEARTPIRPLWDALDVAFPSNRDPANHTYVPWGSNRADRTIDYAFARGLSVADSRVIAAGAAFSDHLPIVLDLAIPPAHPRKRGMNRPNTSH